MFFCALLNQRMDITTLFFHKGTDVVVFGEPFLVAFDGGAAKIDRELVAVI